MNRRTIAVTGMSCGGCEQNVETALRSVEGLTRVEADHEGDTVEVVVEDDVAADHLHTAIKDAGYDVVA